MYRLLPLVLVSFLLTPVFLQAQDAQIEFTGELEGFDPSADPPLVQVRLTPGLSVPLQVSEATEIRNEEGVEIGLDGLELGQLLRVRGLFAPTGILALEIEVVGDVAEFELRGVIEAIGEGRRIEVVGLAILVPESAEIKDQFGNLLTFAELDVGQTVRVEGAIREGELVASEVTVRTARDGFARVRFRGVVNEVIDDSTLIVLLAGDVPVQVVLTPQTEVKGELAVGVLVRVTGILLPDLAVEATRIQVQRLLQLAPPRLSMRTDQRRRVVVILRSPFDEAVTLRVESRDPAVAEAGPMDLEVPAGKITSFFEVLSGSAPGETIVDVSLPAEQGGLRVELPVQVRAGDDEPEEDELELQWQPGRLSAAPPGRRDVRLQLNQPAPADLVVRLSVREGTADLVVFPEEVLIPAGERAAPVALEILSAQAEARIRAALPEDAGGDTDDLEIQPERVFDRRLQVEWVPDEVEVGVGEEFEVALRLNQPAPADFTVFVRRQGGGQSGSLEGVPSEVRFEAGATEVVLQLRALRRGKVRLRASLPVRLGGRHADLRVEIE